jgi:cobalt/nickel transport system permease protein
VTHHSLDPYIEGASPLHRRDPRAKLLATVALIAAIVLTPAGAWASFGLFLLLVAGLIIVAKVPAVRLLKRSLVALPFVLPAAVFLPFLHGGDILWQAQLGGWHLMLGRDGLELAGSIVARAWLSVAALAVLMATTQMSDLLNGLEKLRVPRIFVSLFGFMYRYLFVLEDEAMRLKTGRDVRYFSRSTRLGISSVGHMAGSLFLRSYERAERVYDAMLLRGYDGESRSLNPLKGGYADILLFAAITIIAVSINIISRWL